MRSNKWDSSGSEAIFAGAPCLEKWVTISELRIMSPKLQPISCWVLFMVGVPLGMNLGTG